MGEFVMKYTDFRNGLNKYYTRTVNVYYISRIVVILTENYYVYGIQITICDFLEEVSSVNMSLNSL